MTPPRIIYAVEFPVRGNHGKSKATAEKQAAFSQLLGSHFRFLSMGRSGSLLSFPVFFFEFLYTVVAFRPRVVFYRGALSFIASLICKAFRVQLVVECHASFEDEARVLGVKSIRRIAMNLLEQFLRASLRVCNAAVFNNPRLMRHYAKIIPGVQYKMLVSHNGTDTAFFIPGDKAVARAEIGVPADATILAFVGSQSVWHGTANLIKLSEHLRVIGSDIIVLIAGGANTLSSHRAVQQSENLFTMGHVTKSTAATIIHAADACLLPVNDCRVSPGSPLKLFDYASCGRTIITQEAMEGYSDIVCRHRIGYCIDFNQPHLSAAAIHRIATDRKLIIDESHIRNVALREFDWRIIVSNWIAFSLQVRLHS